jgi:hypothetical protein
MRNSTFKKKVKNICYNELNKTHCTAVMLNGICKTNLDLQARGINEQFFLNNYWIRPEKDTGIKYADISVYKEPNKIKLLKLSFAFNKRLLSGIKEKYFDIRNGKVHLIKGVSSDIYSKHTNDVISEILSSHIAEAIGVNSVKYESEMSEKNELRTVCPVFTDENTDAYTVTEFNETEKNFPAYYSLDEKTKNLIHRMELYGISADETKKYITEATILDTVLQCWDRNSNNISILVDANTNKVKGYAPHYDFGCCNFNGCSKKRIYEPFRQRLLNTPQEIFDDLSENGIDLKSAWNSVSSALDSVLQDKNSIITEQVKKIKAPLPAEEYLNGYKYNAEFLDNAVNEY